MEFSSQNTGVGSLSLLQGIFPSQGWNPGLPHCGWIIIIFFFFFFCGWIINQLRATKEAQEYWSNLSLLQRIFLTQELNWGLLHCRRILYQLSCQGSLMWNTDIIFSYTLHEMYHCIVHLKVNLPV